MSQLVENERVIRRNVGNVWLIENSRAFGMFS